MNFIEMLAVGIFIMIGVTTWNVVLAAIDLRRSEANIRRILLEIDKLEKAK